MNGEVDSAILGGCLERHTLDELSIIKKSDLGFVDLEFVDFY